jgi:restriction endonuclease S subunit
MKKLSEIFDIVYGNQFDLNKMLINDNSTINFVSRGATNLGVVAKVDKFNNKEPFDGGCITVALGGSVLSSFVQTNKFYTGQNIKVLKPKSKMSFELLVYYSLCIEKNKFRYSSHGREANVTLNDIMVPTYDEVPFEHDFNIQNEIDNLKTPKNSNHLILDNITYQNFLVEDIFEVTGTKTTPITKLNKIGEGEYPYVTTSSKNFGQNGKFNFYTENGHVLTLESAVNGVCFYQEKEFSASDHVEKLIPKNKVSKEFLIYVSVLINKQTFRFNYGRKANQDRIKNMVISLPVVDSKIDYDFIDKFMGSLEYSGKI